MCTLSKGPHKCVSQQSHNDRYSPGKSQTWRHFIVEFVDIHTEVVHPKIQPGTWGGQCRVRMVSLLYRLCTGRCVYCLRSRSCARDIRKHGVVNHRSHPYTRIGAYMILCIYQRLVCSTLLDSWNSLRLRCTVTDHIKGARCCRSY